MKRRNFIRTMLFWAAGIFMASGSHAADAKAETIRLDPGATKIQIRRPAGVAKAKKVKITNPKKSVVKVWHKKNKQDKRIIFTAKKNGTVSVTVKCYLGGKKIKKYRYKVKVGPVKKLTSKDKAKRAFRIQNWYRKEKNAGALEWSDELYAFCLYRIKTSGFDRHENLARDQSNYFGNFAKFKKLALAENLYSGSSKAEHAMQGWKNSPGHYTNLMMPSHICGAIACEKGVWCAIFYDRDKAELKNWKNVRIKEITVRRYDRGTGMYLSECSFAYYEEDDSSTLEAAMMTKTSGKNVYLEVGKTYVFYERKTPDGYGRAEPFRFTVTEDGESKIVLKS